MLFCSLTETWKPSVPALSFLLLLERPNHKQLKEEGIYWAYSSKARSIIVGKAKVGTQAASGYSGILYVF